MRYWDASALIPTIIEERPASAACRHLLQQDPRVNTAFHSRVEVVSGLSRKRREGGLSEDEYKDACARVRAASARWRRFEPGEDLWAEAERLLGAHPIRTGDALQLASAVLLVQRKPKKHIFVTGDGPLARAAEAEKFTVFVPG